MVNNKKYKPEISYVIQDVLPVLHSQYDFPSPDNEESVKVEEIPIQMGSGIKKPDVIYFFNDIPVFLVESKKPKKSLQQAIDQAMSYIRNYPVSKYSKNGLRPRFFSVTIGKDIYFYAHRYEFDKNNNFKDWAEKIDSGISFNKLLQEYGLVNIATKKELKPSMFRKEFLNELIAIYNLDNGLITPDIVSNVTEQLLSFLEAGDSYTSRKPYINLDNYKDRQTQIRQLFKKFNLADSLNPDLAKEFRRFILRAFQGTKLNQFLTEQTVIVFMVGLLSNQISTKSKILDFECGSGGYLAACIDKYSLKLDNVKGIDIDNLAYITAKTYLALYFNKTKQNVSTIPIYIGNGLFDQGKSQWDIIISNPSGNDKYERNGLEEIFKTLDSDLDGNNIIDKISEYNLSLQQSIRSCKVGGKICILLPEGFFCNSKDYFLREFVLSHCKIEALISIPRGVFKMGTNIKSQSGGAQTNTQKMSVVLLTKNHEVENPNTKQVVSNIDYPIFIASVYEDDSDLENIIDKVEPKLKVVLEQWINWQENKRLLDFNEKSYKDLFKPYLRQDEKIIDKSPDNDIDKIQIKADRMKEKITKTYSEINIDDSLKGLFKK